MRLLESLVKLISPRIARWYPTVQQSTFCLGLIFSTELPFSIYHENRPKCLLFQARLHCHLPTVFPPLHSGLFPFSAGQWLGNVQITFLRQLLSPCTNSLRSPPVQAAAFFLRAGWNECVDLKVTLCWKRGMNGDAWNRIHSIMECFFLRMWGVEVHVA